MIVIGLNLPDISLNCTNFCSLPPHHINAKLTELGAEKLITRILTLDTIPEISQYDFDMENMTVHPMHVKPPNNEKESKDIAGL